MNTSYIKDKLPMHVFFIAQGISLFGVGYAALPMLLLVLWLCWITIKTPDVFKDLFADDRCYWVWIYYLLFIIMVFVSDLAVGGKLTHLDGPLYSLSLGIYMLLGYLVARIYNLDEVLMLAHRWLAFWIFLLLSIAEIYYREVYRYHHGIFTHPHVFYSGLVMMALAFLVFTIEYFEYKKVFSWVSCFLALWALFSVYKYSISDIVPHLFMAGTILVMLFSRKRYSMYILTVLILGGALSVAFNSQILSKLQAVNLIPQDLWMDLLNHREFVWTVSIRILGQHPFLGIGSGNFNPVCKEILANMGALDSEGFAHTHNIFFQCAVTHGLIAGFAFIGLMLSVFRFAIRSLKTVSNETMTWATLAILFVYVFHGQVDIAPCNEEMIPFIWGCFGLLMGVVVKGVNGR